MKSLLALVASMLLVVCLAGCDNKQTTALAQNSPPRVIKDTVYVVHLRSDGPYCDVFYWLDTKTHTCFAKTCSDTEFLMPKDQCNILIDTYVKAER